jgi:hypothetical protein
VEYGLFSGFFMNKFACRKKMTIDIFLVTKVYLSLHIWKEHVEIDQIMNFHQKINWQTLLYRIPLSKQSPVLKGQIFLIIGKDHEVY